MSLLFFSNFIFFIIFPDASLTSHIEEYDLGKRHLANIMGKDPDDFSQEDVDVSTAIILGQTGLGKQCRPRSDCS